MNRRRPPYGLTQKEFEICKKEYRRLQSGGSQETSEKALWGFTRNVQRNLEIFEEYAFAGKTYAEIGESRGLTRQRCHQVVTQILWRLIDYAGLRRHDILGR